MSMTDPHACREQAPHQNADDLAAVGETRRFLVSLWGGRGFGTKRPARRCIGPVWLIMRRSLSCPVSGARSIGSAKDERSPPRELRVTELAAHRSRVATKP
jgi:hypothetical protein